MLLLLFFVLGYIVVTRFSNKRSIRSTIELELVVLLIMELIDIVLVLLLS